VRGGIRRIGVTSYVDSHVTTTFVTRARIIMAARLVSGVVVGVASWMTGVDAAYTKGEWMKGRATYFDAPDAWKQKFSQQIFGDLYGNACGYVNKGAGRESNANFPFLANAVAAVADFDPKLHDGACGSCFEIKCESGRVRNTPDSRGFVYSVERGFWETDPNATDTLGRRLAKRGAERDVDDGIEYEYARCWNESATIKVRIIDTCPCNYITGTQEICCGPVPHFDLSYWAYETIAHPLQGKINILFRPIQCEEDGVVLDYELGAKARISRTIFSDGVVGAGWAWLPYKDKWLVIERPGYGRNGHAANCLQVDPEGRIAFTCWSCERQAKPFDGTYISFWLRTSCTSNFDAPMYLGISTRTRKEFLNGTIVAEESESQVGIKRLLESTFFDSRTIDDNCGRRAVVPLAEFASTPARANTFAIELAAPTDPAWARTVEKQHHPVTFCVDDVVIVP